MTTIIDGVAIERNHSVSMRDGTVLRADVYRPTASGVFPVLLLRIPYNKTVAQGYVYANPVWYARHGYIVVVQDTRGRYESDGEFTPLLSEAADGMDTIAWCSRLPGATGRVGTFGFSYSGINQLLAASLAPDALAAACPGFYPTSMYDHFSFVNGAFCLATIAHWLVILAPNFAARRKDWDGLSLARAAEAMVGRWHPGTSASEVPLIAPNALTGFAADLLAHPARDRYWESTDTLRLTANDKLPCLHIGGWYDTFIDQTIAGFKRYRATSTGEQRLLIGPWLHIPWSRQVGQIDFGPDASNVVDDHQLAFFDAHLKSDRRRIDALPALSVFMMGRNAWVEMDDWPSSGYAATRLYLHSRGRANTSSGDGWLDTAPPEDELVDTYVYDPLMPVLSAGGHACCSPDVTPMGAYDQSVIQMRNDVLIYDMAPVDRPMRLAGPVEVELWVSTTAPDTDFAVKLCHIRGDGRSINLCESIQRLRFATDPSREIFLEPDVPHRIHLLVGQTAVELSVGERLRLEITSSNYPAFDRNPNTGGPIGTEGAFDCQQSLQAVYHTTGRPSSLILHVRNL